MIYEWRTYEALPGKLPALHTHLEVAAGLFKKHALGVLGFWTEEIGTGGQVTYMWMYADLEDRQKKVAAFGADSAWKQQVAEETEAGRLPDLHIRFANHTLRLFAKHGIANIGYWTEVFGTSNRLVYRLGYPSLGDREKSWAAFQTDPDWQQARAESEKNGPLVAKTYNRILRPTAYSPKG